MFWNPLPLRWKLRGGNITNRRHFKKKSAAILLIAFMLSLFFLKTLSLTSLTSVGEGESVSSTDRTIAVFASSPNVYPDKHFYFDLFYCLMGQGIPGLNAPWPEALLPGNLVIGLTRIITGMNPVEPGSILSSGISAFSLAVMPVSHEEGLTGIINQENTVLEPEEFSGGDEEGLYENGNRYYPPDEQAVILIYHSHITETFYPTTGKHFTDDKDVNMAVLGRMLAELLEKEYNIPVMHNSQVFDIPRRSAYPVARPHIAGIIKDNPRIKMVIDLHRDGISRKSTTTAIDGEETGKVLMVVGSGFDGWEKNFEFALVIQQELEKINPLISRGVRRQQFTYNQDLHKRAVLIEAGGHLNSLEEVKKTIPFLAEALAATYENLFGK